MQVFCTVCTEICVVAELVTPNLSTFTTMKFQFFTLLCCCGLLFFAACEKEQLLTTDSQASESQEITPDAVGDPIAFEVTVEDGMLSFADYQSFASTAATVAKMSESEAKELIDGYSYESMYYAVEKIIDRLEHMPFEQVVSDLSDEERKYVQVIDNQYIEPIQSIRSIAILLNKDGCVLIGDQLYYFSDKENVLVVDKDMDLLNSALKAKSSFVKDRVFYSAQQEIIEVDNRNVNTQFLKCPNATNFEVYSTQDAKRGRLRLRRFSFFSNYETTGGVESVVAKVNIVATWNNYKRRRFWNWVKEWKVSRIRVLPNFMPLRVWNSVKFSNGSNTGINFPDAVAFAVTHESTSPVSTFEKTLSSATSERFDTFSGMKIQAQFATGRVEAQRAGNNNVRGICGCD